jgi:glycosyltransferase involved in cell wall biosynthesis
VERPPAEVADAFFRLHHNEVFGTGGMEDMGGRTSLPSALSSGTGSDAHAAACDALQALRWRQGALRTSQMSAWWQRATPERRGSVPIEVTRACSPAIVRATGSRLAVYAPAPLRGSGGHRTLFNVVRRLSRLGLSPEIFLEGVGAGVEVAESYLQDCEARIHTQWHRHIPADVAFASIAHSAAFVAELTSVHHRGYLVQDLEATFNPISDAYVVAENSYALGLQHFTIGNWLTHVLGVEYGAASCPAGLGIDVAAYHPLKEGKARARELAVCFLYQPDKPRRTPGLGIEALRQVKQALPETTICVYGSDQPLSLDFAVENMGLVHDLAELNRLYNKCTVGLCISASNPSRIPFEMMAAGCVPVDLYRYNNLMDHADGTILLAYQNSQSIAAAILSLLTEPDRASRMSAAAMRFAGSRTLDWEVDVIANNVLAMMEDTLPATWPCSMRFTGAPLIAPKGDTQSVRRFCETQRRLAQRRHDAHDGQAKGLDAEAIASSSAAQLRARAAIPRRPPAVTNLGTTPGE